MGAYFSYSLAHLEFFQLSGDVAIFFYGVMMAHYNKYNMSLESFNNIALVFNTFLFIAEALCYIYIGLSIDAAIIDHPENLIIGGAVLGCLIVSRIFVMVPFSILSCKKLRLNIKGAEWIAVMSSGLIKGPMAFIFANVLVPIRGPCLNPKDPAQYKKAYPLFMIQIVVFMTVAFYNPINYLIFKCTVSKELHQGREIETEKSETVEFKQKLAEGKWVHEETKPRVILYIDEFALKPFFIRDYKTRRKEILEMKDKFEAKAGKWNHAAHLDHYLEKTTNLHNTSFEGSSMRDSLIIENRFSLNSSFGSYGDELDDDDDHVKLVGRKTISPAKQPTAFAAHSPKKDEDSPVLRKKVDSGVYEPLLVKEEAKPDHVPPAIPEHPAEDGSKPEENGKKDK